MRVLGGAIYHPGGQFWHPSLHTLCLFGWHTYYTAERNLYSGCHRICYMRLNEEGSQHRKRQRLLHQRRWLRYWCPSRPHQQNCKVSTGYHCIPPHTTDTPCQKSCVPSGPTHIPRNSEFWMKLPEMFGYLACHHTDAFRNSVRQFGS